MTTDWRDTLTEDRYATRGSRHLRALRDELEAGPLADEMTLPDGVTVEQQANQLTFSGDVPALLKLTEEFHKLARSPSGSTARLGEVLFEVSNDLDAPTTAGVVRLPWYAWHATATRCAHFAAHGQQFGSILRFDRYNFNTGTWTREWDRDPLVTPPIGKLWIELRRTGRAKGDLDLDEEDAHRAEQRGLPPGSHISEVDYVVELGIPGSPGYGAPEPRLWINSSEAVLAYNCLEPDDTGEETIAVLRFPSCVFAMFGAPGHNGFLGHPLTRRGLKLYGIYEVLNSSFSSGRRQWMTDARGVPIPANLYQPSGSRGAIRHFIVTFHDDMFECLADDIISDFTSDLSPFIDQWNPAIRSTTT